MNSLSGCRPFDLLRFSPDYQLINIIDCLTASSISDKLEHMSEKWIRASDINQYVFCSRSWWLQRDQNVLPADVRQLERGAQHHRHHGQLWSRSLWARWAGYALLFAVVAIATFQLLTLRFGL